MNSNAILCSCSDTLKFYVFESPKSFRFRYESIIYLFEVPQHTMEALIIKIYTCHLTICISDLVEIIQV